MPSTHTGPMQPVTTTLVVFGGVEGKPSGSLDLTSRRGTGSCLQGRVSETEGERENETEFKSADASGVRISGLLARVLTLSRSIRGSPTFGPRNLSRSKVDGCVQK